MSDRMLRLFLFGPPRLEREGQAMQVSRRKSLAMLAYLAATGQRHSRDTLATLLGPEMSQRRARGNLRRVLSDLNREIGEGVLVLEGETVGLAGGDSAWADVTQFRAYLAAIADHHHPAEEICSDCLPLLIEASDLYQADFLAGFSLRDTAEFDEWLYFEAEGLRREYASILARLIDGLIASSDFEAAITHARRWVALDRLHEPAHRRLMKLYALSGQQAAALRQYEICLTLLDDELGIAPEEETTRLYQDIKARRLGQEAAGTAGSHTVLAGQTPVARARFPVEEAALTRPVTDTLPAFLTSEDEPPSEPPVFVAREQELAQLETALDSARSGRGQILFVIGGAGRGKTTLMREFARRAQAADPDLVIVTGYCKAIVGIGDPYLPFREALTVLTGDVDARWAGGLIDRKQARRLWELMPLTLPALVENAPDLIDRFVPAESLRRRAAKAVPNHTPLLDQIVTQTSRGQSDSLDQTAIFAQYAALLKAIADQRPLLIIIEDLHWVDAASSALLFYLSNQLGDSQILLVGTYRPEGITPHPPSTSGTRVEAKHPLTVVISELKRQYGDVWLDLTDLTGKEGRRFVEAYLDTQPNRLGKEFRETLFRRTAGHALFTVELLRAMQERGDLWRDEEGFWTRGETIDWTTLPVKVEGVIEGRIKRLPESLQSVLSTASVEGETFTAEVVARVQQVDDRSLVQQLSRELDKQHRLVTAQAIEWLIPGQQRLSIYRFQHHLLQHYLYHRLDELERGHLHEAVGNALEELYDGQTQLIAGQLAHHFQAAGLVAKAIHYLSEAGDAAVAVHANIEAAAHYGRAVELAEQEKISAEELAHLYVSLGGQLMVTKGDGSPEVGEAYARALELYGSAGESPQRFAALRGSTLYHKLRGESARARELSEEMLTLAHALGDPVLIVEACYAMGSHFFYLGDYLRAQEYLEQAIQSYDRQQHQSLISLYGQDAGVANLCYACLTLWFLGYPESALRRSTEAIALAQELSHPYSLAMAHTWSAWLHFYRRESQAVLERTEVAIGLSTKHNFTIFLGVGKLLRGWALIGRGDVAEGISETQQGKATAVLATGSEDVRTEWSALLADSYRKAGQPERALTVLAQAPANTEESPSLEWGQPEIYRLKGELLLFREGRAAYAEAETCFQQAIDAARRQGARSMELRALVSLSHLWRSLGKRERAYQQLAELYDWFTEGFETKDLIAAKILLDKLAPV